MIRRSVLIALSAMFLAPAAASATVSGTSAWHVSGTRNLGPMPTRSMTVTLALAPRNAAALRSLVASRHAALTRQQFNARFEPAAATVRAIRAWAKANHLTVRSVSANRLLVRLSGSSKAFATALDTSFHRFSSPATGQFFQITRSARLPKAFAGKLTAVLGLSNLGKVSLPHPATRSASALGAGQNAVTGALSSLGAAAPAVSYPAAYGPKDFWSIYDAPASQTGSGQQLAIITEGDVSQPEKDLAQFEQTYGLPTVTWNQINVGTPSTDTSGDDEWDLDSQYSTAFAPGVSQLNVYVAPSLDDQDIVTAINRWVTDDTSAQGSFSAGECELLADASGMLSSLDTVLEEADAQGQTMFFSSGDTGSQCPAIVAVNGVPAGIPGDNYPASSPWGIGVGGTSILSPSGPDEIAWYAGGGGASVLEPTPAFQSSTTVGGAPLLTRGVPDVSLDADPESGYDVVVDGTVEVVGGTSAGAPSWQGIWARAQGAHSGSLGFAGPVIYQTEPASAFHDITLGGNGLYTALPGWDYVTGRGTPDITSFVDGA